MDITFQSERVDIMQVKVSATNGTFQFGTGPGDSILHSALRAGVPMPYECASGTCGTCRATLVSGDVMTRWLEAPGHGSCKAANEILTCQCEARTDCEIQFTSGLKAPSREPLPLKSTTFRLVGAKVIAPDVMFLKLDSSESFAFEAGQFALVEAPGIVGARAYSMVNHEESPNSIEFVVKRKSGGELTEWLFTSHLMNHFPELTVTGPLGKAFFHPDMDCNIACIAGGSGVAGMMSILNRALASDFFTRHSAKVYFGVRTPGDAFFLDRFESMTIESQGGLEVNVAFSSATDDAGLSRCYPHLKFSQGLVHEVAIEDLAANGAPATFYIAGPEPLVNGSIRALMTRLKVSPASIRYDKFS